MNRPKQIALSTMKRICSQATIADTITGLDLNEQFIPLSLPRTSIMMKEYCTFIESYNFDDENLDPLNYGIKAMECLQDFLNSRGLKQIFFEFNPSVNPVADQFDKNTI